LGELHLAEFIVMAIFGDNVFGLCCHSTVNKLVIVRVGGYKIEFVESVDEKRVRVVKDDFEH